VLKFNIGDLISYKKGSISAIGVVLYANNQMVTVYWNDVGQYTMSLDVIVQPNEIFRKIRSNCPFINLFKL